jgi:hypothetical protein
LEAWPIVWACAHAGEWRRSHAGSAAQDVVGGIQAEIIAEPKLATAEAKMDVVAARAANPAANPSGETEADGSAASAKSHACVAAAKAETHASVTTAPAKAETHASVTAATGAATEAKTHAVTAAASTAHRGLRRCWNRQREGKRRHGRQK